MRRQLSAPVLFSRKRPDALLPLPPPIRPQTQPRQPYAGIGAAPSVRRAQTARRRERQAQLAALQQQQQQQPDTDAAAAAVSARLTLHLPSAAALQQSTRDSGIPLPADDAANAVAFLQAYARLLLSSAPSPSALRVKNLCVSLSLFPFFCSFRLRGPFSSSPPPLLSSSRTFIPFLRRL